MTKLPHRFRRGFILFFGTRELATAAEGDPLPEARCPRCAVTGSLGGVRVRNWFTFFFIPTFPLGPGRHYTKCRKCGASFAMPPEEFEGAAARADARQLQRAITMYNSLRASPGNSVTLNELLQLYASMAEYGQAISAANDFPQAVQNSEQVMTTLGRVNLAAERFIDAETWFEKALDRNPDLGEAWFHLALTVLKILPRDVPRAIAAAKAAKKAGYPAAEELLADLESEQR